MCGQIAVVKAAAVAHPMALPVKGQPRRQDQSRIVIRRWLRAVWLWDTAVARGRLGKIIQPVKDHLPRPCDLGDGDPLPIPLRLQQQRMNCLIPQQELCMQLLQGSLSS